MDPPVIPVPSQGGGAIAVSPFPSRCFVGLFLPFDEPFLIPALLPSLSLDSLQEVLVWRIRAGSVLG